VCACVRACVSAWNNYEHHYGHINRSKLIVSKKC